MMKNTVMMFAYGMNTNTSGMATRCPGAVSLGHAILPRHEFRFAVHADVLENPEHEVHGVLWEITPEHLESLDRLEGYPYYYNRKEVTVLSGNKEIKALVYFMLDGNPDDYPSTGYYNMVLEGYVEHDVPTHQLYEAVGFINQYSQQYKGNSYDYYYH